MSIPKPKSAFAYSPPTDVLPERWLAAVLGSKRPMIERSMALAFAWAADRHGNPIPSGAMNPMLRAATGLPNILPADKKRIGAALQTFENEGWLQLKLSEPNKDGVRFYVAYGLRFPSIVGAGGQS